MSIVNYYAFLESLNVVFFIPLDNLVKTLGYNFSIKEPIIKITKNLIPSFLVVEYALHLNNKNLKEKIKRFYNKITNLQLILLSLLLPSLLYLQNNVFGHIKEINNNK